jgi:hypothetical protein
MSLAMTARSIRGRGVWIARRGHRLALVFLILRGYILLLLLLVCPFSVLLLLVFVLSFPFSTTPPSTSRHSQPPAPSSPKSQTSSPASQPASLCKVVSQLCSSVNVLLTRSSAKYFIDIFSPTCCLIWHFWNCRHFFLHTWAATSNTKPK